MSFTYQSLRSSTSLCFLVIEALLTSRVLLSWHFLLLLYRYFDGSSSYRACLPHLRSLGLEVKFSQVADPQIFVGKVPVCFMEKESNELRRGRPSVIKPIVEVRLPKLSQ